MLTKSADDILFEEMCNELSKAKKLFTVAALIVIASVLTVIIAAYFKAEPIMISAVIVTVISWAFMMSASSTEDQVVSNYIETRKLLGRVDDGKE